MSFKKTGKSETLGVIDPQDKKKAEASAEVKQDTQSDKSDKKVQK